ncbi:MAG: ferrous iron transport protein B, partial [Acutalibacteraceae bacterium]|nr:ferrous iron transport protein B [Acutalibacteraceae bacterium]
VDHAIAHIEEAAVHDMPAEHQRWYAIKIFERDDKVLEQLKLDETTLKHIEEDIAAAEHELDDDAESIITNERYVYIASIMKGCYKKKSAAKLSTSDKIDKIVTNRILALPIFVLIMFLVYKISIGTIGDWTVGFMNDTLFGEWIVPAVTSGLESIGCVDWLVSLIADGIVGGVGAVLGFVPQMLILFLLLSILEDCGYMARVAFIMDRIFRKFGLSGKSFIPMLIASGCGVPGIMASRTIENERDRRMTIITTGFIPCGAKMPIVGLIAAALFGNSAWVATSAYFIGVAAVIISGIMLKKTKMFAGDPAPFVMELPAYHAPTVLNVLRATWERGWSFIKRAGTVIVIASIVIWVLNSLTFEGGFHYIGEGDENSILNVIGSAIAVIFKPLGFGNWQAAVATVLGLVAKEEVVGVFGSLSSMADADLAFSLVEEGSAELSIIGAEFFDGSKLAAFSFMIFNLLCAPCFAAMGAIKREMNNAKWTAFAIGYMCAFAYIVSLVVYQIGCAFTGNLNIVGLIIALIAVAGMLYMLFKPYKESTKLTQKVKVK